MVAGGVGNLIDRTLHGGWVTDFVVLAVGPLRTRVFNLTYALTMVGMVWFFISTVSNGRESAGSGS
ncbi:MAG: signal peptidase II [Chloroflexota bacterium]